MQQLEYRRLPGFRRTTFIGYELYISNKYTIGCIANVLFKAAKDLNEKRKMLYNTTLKDKVKVIKDKVILGSIDSDEAIAILNEFEKNK